MGRCTPETPRRCSPRWPPARLTASCPARPTWASGTTAYPAGTVTRTSPPPTWKRCATCSARRGASWPMTGRAGQPHRLLLRQRRRGHRDACLPRRGHHHPPGGRAGRDEPARPPPGGSRSPCRRTAGFCRTRSSGTSQRNARIGARPPILPARTAVPARQVAGYLSDLDPIRVPHAEGPRPERRTGPPGHPRGPARPPKYGPGTPEVVAARRHPAGRSNRRHPNGGRPSMTDSGSGLVSGVLSGFRSH